MGMVTEKHNFSGMIFMEILPWLINSLQVQIVKGQSFTVDGKFYCILPKYHHKPQNLIHASPVYCDTLDWKIIFHFSIPKC